MNRCDLYEEAASAFGTAGQMGTDGAVLRGGTLYRSPFVGRIGSGPILRTTFVFGTGTAIRT
jgi:hypothetical protein